MRQHVCECMCVRWTAGDGGAYTPAISNTLARSLVHTDDESWDEIKASQQALRLVDTHTLV